MTGDRFFQNAFSALTGNPPFPWQEELYESWFSKGEIPSTCDLPTGLGKTSVVAIWLIALATHPKRMPRRLVYVVNRRTVVDQTTNEVMKLRQNLHDHPTLQPLRDQLGSLAISTLRGQFADNHEWSADPSRPAVISGTVDMIGSRLLFSGYRIGFKSQPLHAGFLGQDSLLVHDEAHLEPAFQKLITDIEKEQKRERKRSGDLPWPKLQVMALSATARNTSGEGSAVFTLTNEDHKHQIVTQRHEATKTIRLHSCDDEKKQLVSQVLELALEHKESGDAILVFLRGVDNALDVFGKLKKARPDHVAPLTGTMRGLERDGLVENPVFVRFLPKSDRPEDVTPAEGTVYLVCTSAGEVGVNLSADHIVCDLSTFDSMAQRFGRVNRFGQRTDTRIDVVHPGPDAFDSKHPLTPRRIETVKLLKRLNGDASPKALGELPGDQRLAAFAPKPTILPATDILFDAWALTTIREKMPGCPPVEPYLHGVAEWEPLRTSVAWRQEVSRITEELIERHGEDFPQNLLEDYPLKPHELLSDTTERVYKQLQLLIAEPKASVKGEKRQRALERARRNTAANTWLIDENGAISVTSLGELLTNEKKRVTERLAGSTVLLPPSVGGLVGGMLDGTSELADDVADITDGPDQRIRIHPDDADFEAAMARTANMRRVRSIELSAGDDEDDEPRLWEWYESLPLEGGRTAKKPVLWETHVKDVVDSVTRLVAALSLPKEIADAINLAAKLHDHGKRRERFQTTLGNRWYPDVLLAKSGKRGARLPEPFRHEFVSVLDAQADDAFNNLNDELKDLVLHVIAAHHGRARPHFDLDEAFDPERPSSDAEALAIDTPRRFARLQRKYGRWGLAYLESLLRAGDWAASANPSAYADEPEDKK